MTPPEFMPTQPSLLQDACDVMSQAYRQGLISTRDGNISLATPERNGFLISPSGVVKHALTPAQFVFISADSPRTTASIPASRPSGELELHRRLQALFHGGPLTVLHLHATHIVAALYAGLQLRDVSADFPEVTRYTRVGADVAALAATSEELAEACEAAFRPALGPRPHIVGLDRHGVVAVGRTPWEAYEHVERLEHICRIVLVSGRTPQTASHLGVTGAGYAYR